MRKLELKMIIENNELAMEFEDLTQEEIKQAQKEIKQAKLELSNLNKDDYTLNFLNKYVPKKHHVAIMQVDYDSLDGYFIYLTDDYIFSTTEGHYMNALTLKEIKKEFKYIVKK